MGGWGLTSEDGTASFDINLWDIQEAVTLAHKHGFGPLFEFSVSIDERNSSAYAITVSWKKHKLKKKARLFYSG